MIDVDLSLNVSQVNEYIKNRLENDENLHYLIINGEISNWKKPYNGHYYFSLKDEKSTIQCVMFNDYASKLKFIPKDGDQVKVVASISVFAPRGSYSLRIYSMDEKGKGQQLLELEELKKKLQKEGLFDDSRKKPINTYPTAIGLVTAPNSAALKDMVTNIHRRYPPCNIYVFPCQVQGEGSAKDILRAYNLALTYKLDTIIIGRGGGSSEDLNSFNDEALVRAVAASNIPTISAVGHEIDMTLIDFVSDKRASTPTGAAELATIDKHEVQELMMNYIQDMKDAIEDKVENAKETFMELKEDLSSSINDLIDKKRNTLVTLNERLIAIDPTKVMNRGFSITQDDNGNVITSIKQIKNGQKLTTSLKDGIIHSKVEEQ